MMHVDADTIIGALAALWIILSAVCVVGAA